MANSTEDLVHSNRAMIAQSEGTAAYIAYLEKRKLIHIRAWHLEKNEDVKKVHVRQWKQAKKLLGELS